MKNKFILSTMFLLLFLGMYSSASYSQTFNMWLTNDTLIGNAWSFDVYIQRTGTTPLVVYAFQIGFNYTASATNGGTLTAGWSNIDPTITAQGETPKAVSCITIPYIKCGFNVNPTGVKTGVTVPDATPMKIGTLTVTNSIPFIGLPLISWYFGGAPGLPTKIQATNDTLAYDATSKGTFFYVSPHGGLLPVELTSFKSDVNGRQVNLNWETKTEVNTREFEIDRAIINTKDASIIWTSVGNIHAAGTSTTPKKYSYTDKNLQAGKYQYRLKMIDNDGSYKYTSVEAAEVAIPKEFSLSQNYPNPFNPTTKIDYQVPVDAKVIMEVYNITGQKVMELVNQEQSAGYYTINFGSSKLSSGVYIYRIVASDKATGNNFSSIKKMMLLK